MRNYLLLLLLLLYFNSHGQNNYSNSELVVVDSIVNLNKIEECRALLDKKEYDTALNLLNDLISQFNQDSNLKVVAEAYDLRGYCYRNSWKNLKAVEEFKKALEIREKNEAVEINERISNIGNIGYSYHLGEEYKSAISSYERALELIDKSSFKDSVTIATIFISLGNSYLMKGDYVNARSHFYKAVGIKEQLNPLDPAITTLYKTIGMTCLNERNFEMAEEFIYKALDENISKFGSISSQVAESYYSIGVLHSRKFNYQKSFDFIKKGYEIIQPIQGHDLYLARYLSAMGSSQNHLGNCEKAVLFYQQALEVCLSLVGEKHVYTAVAYGGLARCAGKIENFEEALSYMDKALNSINFVPSKVSDKINPIRLIRTLQYQSDIEMARIEKQNNDSLMLNFRETNRFFDSLVYKYRKDDRFARSKTSLSNYSLRHYENAIRNLEKLSVLMNRKGNYIEEAFNYSEKTKSLQLYEAAQESKAVLTRLIPDSIVEKLKKLSIKIEKYSNRIDSFEERDSLGIEATQLLYKTENEYKSTLGILKERFPIYYKIKYSNTTTNIEEIQTVLQPNQALIEYFVGDSSIFIFTITTEDYEIKQIKKDFPLEGWVTQMREGIYTPWIIPDQPTSIFAKANKEYTDAAFKLHQKLIASIELELPKKLIIVPDGVLNYIPFDALITKQKQNDIDTKKYPYLLLDHQISYAYSATLWEEMKNKKHDASKSFLAVAPSFRGAPIASRNISEIRQSLGHLKNNIPEVESINTLMDGKLLLGPEATISSFLSIASDYRILHLSTHGKADDRVGDYSFLAFSESGDSVKNIKLYNRDLYNLRLNADMVVLSACETGLGELQKGEGVLSLSRGFAYAGAKSIVNSLWSVDDASTSKIMERFYFYLKQGEEKDAALRLARLDYLENTNRAEPFFWAAFIPVGDMAPLSMTSFSDYFWLILGVPFLLLIIWFFIKIK